MDYDRLVTHFEELDRSLFLEGEFKAYAEVDSALPIGYGQTISQPSLVLEMTRLLSPEEDSRVLEVGTGSGYQTALLAPFAKEVFTVERIRELSDQAQDRLEALGYGNIRFKVGDGSLGWPEEGPFDRIMVTAAAGRIPEELVDQMKEGGRMVIPVGPPSMQELLLVTKDLMGEVDVEAIENVRFVELKGKYGWR
ncbi:protein-L-isoaspartate(D-aspartate) O-methyltransferase [Anaerotalea alkaliphila]|uniref:Protein-L-isoaspartate O-methyltransferase n=1 Tax=Anaerotalea alkaliphila TaxID=2662126 RepID=A0A7X5KL55_9FIRM|nr:protein-L-isoaspartate(D-aspartate) O-methyltransferase [Anaerotalea alkaliphila]NDL66481.1 protein-L-isoaspartate(D-aspartate) O-methyltransferase [Anaerotalea alkaliphila]